MGGSLNSRTLADSSDPDKGDVIPRFPLATHNRATASAGNKEKATGRPSPPRGRPGHPLEDIYGRPVNGNLIVDQWGVPCGQMSARSPVSGPGDWRGIRQPFPGTRFRHRAYPCSGETGTRRQGKGPFEVSWSHLSIWLYVENDKPEGHLVGVVHFSLAAPRQSVTVPSQALRAHKGIRPREESAFWNARPWVWMPGARPRTRVV